MIATVFLREELSFSTIDVSFMNTSFHHNLVLSNDYNATMAVVGYSGLLTASKGQDKVNLDEYEDDDQDEMMDVDEK